MKLLDAVKGDLDHRKALKKLLDYARELALSFHWGTLGVSIRLNGQSGPITIAWLYPPTEAGFRGLTGITLGYEKRVFQAETPSVFEAYEQMASNLSGSSEVTTESIRGWKISPKDLSCTDFDKVHEEWKRLVNDEKAD